MQLLPTSLAPLATACAKDNNRFGATNGVQLTVDNDGNFIAAATDGRQLIRVQGTCDTSAAPNVYPSIPALDASPNGETSAVIPAKDWKDIFTQAAKLTGKKCKPILKNVPVVIGKEVTSFAATNLESSMFQQPRNIDGRFPNHGQIIPPTESAWAAVRVDPWLLADLLTAVAKMGTTDDACCVTLELHGTPRNVSVIGLRGNSSAALTVDAAIVPLRLKEDSTDPRPATEEQAAAQQEAMDLEAMKRESAMYKKMWGEALDESAGRLEQIETLQSTVKELSGKPSDEQLANVNSLLRRNFDAAQARAVKAEKALEDSNDPYELESARERVKELEKELDELQKRYDALDEKADEHADELKDAKEAFAELEKEFDEINIDYEEIEYNSPHYQRCRAMYRELTAAK